MKYLDYKIIFVESISFNYNGFSKTLLMTSFPFPASLLGVQLWLMFQGVQGVDGAVLSFPVTFKLLKKEKQITEVHQSWVRCSFASFLAVAVKNSNLFPFNNTSHQSIFVLNSVSERKRVGVLILPLYKFKSPAILHQDCWNQCFITTQSVQNISLKLILINKI